MIRSQVPQEHRQRSIPYPRLVLFTLPPPPFLFFSKLIFQSIPSQQRKARKKILFNGNISGGFFFCFFFPRTETRCIAYPTMEDVQNTHILPLFLSQYWWLRWFLLEGYVHQTAQQYELERWRRAHTMYRLVKRVSSSNRQTGRS